MTQTRAKPWGDRTDYCQADIEYWSERQKTYVPTPKVVLVKRAVYQSSIIQRDLPWLWQVDKRETSIDINDWEMNTVPMQYCGAGLRRGEYWSGNFLDWCSCYGLTSWYAGHSHSSVTTVETNNVLKKITKANLKRLGTEFYEQKFIDLNCTKYNLIYAIQQIDWSAYDTIRIGSDSYSTIYDAVKNQLHNCKLIIYKPSLQFKNKLESDGWTFTENPKGVDYFTK